MANLNDYQVEELKARWAAGDYTELTCPICGQPISSPEYPEPFFDGNTISMSEVCHCYDCGYHVTLTNKYVLAETFGHASEER